MSIGTLMLVVIALLILFGVLQRVLDRMALTDRQALVCVSAVFIGGWLPDIDFGLITINIGGALVPIAVCVYLLLNAGTAKERARPLAAAVLTAGAVYILGMLLPSDPVAMPSIDPILLYGIAAGLIAWLLGRSRRSAFIAGTLGILLSDLITGFSLWMRGVNQTVHLGGAGALDAVVLAGVSSVLMCELAGEITERIRTGKAQTAHEDGTVEGGNRS